MASSMRSLTVIKELEPPSPKKKLYVTHKFDPTTSAAVQDEFEESLKGNPSPQKATRRADGSYVSWSILGDGASYEHLDSGGGGGGDDASGSVSVRTSRSSRSRSKRNSRSSKSSSKKLVNIPIDPHQELKDHINLLDKFKQDAVKVRTKEKLEEEEILTKLPVHEIFSLNKEGKALSKWQERLNDWSKIENRLARRVGGSSKTLLMNSGDEYRGKNEEYDIMQAAIPIEEKFGPNSWKMMLRGGGEQNVPVGHIFSGLVCKVTTKTVIPKMLRKPLLGSEPRTKNTFLEQSASLTMKRDVLKKKMDSIRPYTMGPSVADGLLVFSTNLFDWAHDSSMRILIDREESERYEEELRQQQQLLEEQNKNAANAVEDPTSSLRVLSPNNLVFTCLKGEGVGSTYSFTNTGRVTITYSWTHDVHRLEDAQRPVWNVLKTREDKSREYTLSNDRSLFFCPRACGRILPGETVHSTFIYCNVGSGGSVSEQWVLQISPQATISYVDVLKRAESKNNLSLMNDKSSAGGGSQGMPPTSKLSIILRGQSHSLDQSGYRRHEIGSRVVAGSLEANIRDHVLECVRRVRIPVRPLVLQRRKLDYFLSRNSAVLHELSDVFSESLPLHLDYSRLQEFEQCYVRCQNFLSEMHVQCVSTVRQWEELSGEFGTVIPAPNLGISGTLRLSDMRMAIFPELELEPFDEISAEDVTPTWDYDMTRVFAICSSARTIVACTIAVEEKIQTRMASDAKEAARAAQRAAAGSDDEEEEEEEEEEDDDEPKPIVIHPLTTQICSLVAFVDGLMHRLVVEPVPLPEEEARSAITSFLDIFEDIELSSREAVGIAPESLVPIFESPFTSEDGKIAWNTALHPPEVVEETGKKGKKAPEKKDKKKDKGAADVVPLVDPEQANLFYKDICGKVVSSVIDCLVDNMFASVDARAAIEANEKLSMSNYTALAELAVLRKEDVPEKGVVFVSVFGPALFSTAQTGAFDTNKTIREKSVEPVVVSAECGASCVVLVFEARTETMICPVQDTVVLMESLVAAAAASALKKEQARPKPRKKDPPLSSIQPVKFKVSIIANFAELQVVLKKLQTEDNVKRKSFPVFVLQDIKSSAVVPHDLYLPDEEEDDDNCPIPIGMQEHHEQRLHTWNAAGPKKVGVITKSGGIVDIFAGPAEALVAVISTFSSGVSPALWVECNPATLFAPPSMSAIQRSAAQLQVNTGSSKCRRVLAGGVRDVASWLTVLSQVPRVPDLLNAKATVEEGVLCDPFTEHVCSLFQTLEEGRAPSLMAAIGGSVRLDKLLAIDKLLDSATVVYVGGEMCIPFFPLVRCVELCKYSELCAAYRTVCLDIMKKARVRGVKLLFPVDVVEGDEEVTVEQKDLCFAKIEAGARDEGADYPGETKTIQLPEYVIEEGVYADISPLKINGYIFDIGPVSCQELKQEIESSEVLFSWGPIGCLEMASFQTGQRVLVTTAVKKPFSEDDEPGAVAVNAASLPLYTIAVGDSCVEWWSRIADSEGEYNGELSQCGIVSCLSRDSTMMCGFLATFLSPSIADVHKRAPGVDEWLYHTRPLPSPEEDEDEDDDEDD